MRGHFEIEKLGKWEDETNEGMRERGNENGKMRKCERVKG